MKINNLIFEIDKRVDFQVIPPEKMLVTKNLMPSEKKNFIEMTSREKSLAMDSGYEVKPLDCPPIRNINNYGFKVFSPLDVEIFVNKNGGFDRKFYENYSQNKYFKFSGTKINFSDSQYIGSWLANSCFFKIITGINIYCPIGYGIFQGPFPISNTKPNKYFQAVAAIEYGNSYGTYEIEKV